MNAGEPQDGTRWNWADGLVFAVAVAVTLAVAWLVWEVAGVTLATEGTQTPWWAD